MSALPADLAAAVDAWLAVDPDPDTRAEIAALRDAGDAETLADRFSGRLEFGTAGLRGRMEGGPTRMNRLVVRQAAAGIARYLADSVDGAREDGVVIVHDARHRSDVFAQDAAEVIAAHGIRVILSHPPLPTPVGVFAIRHLGCAAGIVVTASHNPGADNGMKLFMGDGAQITSPTDADVAARIDAVVADGRILPVGVGAAGIDPLPPAVITDYLSVTRHRIPPPVAPIRIALTAMHGVGGDLGMRLLRDARFEPRTATLQIDYRFLLPSQGLEARHPGDRIRLYGYPELSALLEDAGLRPVAVFGDAALPAVPFEELSQWQVLVAEKRGAKDEG